MAASMLVQRAPIIILLSTALALAGCANTEEGPVGEDFEKGIRDWEKGADIPQDPNRPGQEVSWSIDASREQAHSGSYSANFTLDGSQDDGTIWLVRPVRVVDGQAYEANVTAMAWSQDESFNTRAHLVMYLGLDRPVAEEDFPPPGNNTRDQPTAPRGGLREALDQQAGWREYNFTWNVPADNNEVVWMAIGISAVWETELTFFVDDLEIRMDPVQ